MPPALLEKQESGTAAAGQLSCRIEGLDALRGLCILLMVAFHFAYDLYFYCGFPPIVIDNPLMTFAQVASSGGFILLAGFSSRLSRSNLKRGVRVLLCGLAVSVITWFWGDFIRFGILQFLGCAMVLYGLTQKGWERLPRWPAILLFLFCFVLTKRVMPYVLDVPYLYPFGIVSPEFRSADYFPLLPWFFLFLIGTWLGGWRAQIGQRVGSIHLPVLNWLGRHSLGVYLLHQPILVGVAMGLSILTGHSFSVR